MENMLQQSDSQTQHAWPPSIGRVVGVSRAFAVSVQVCLHSGVISELNYFGQPQLCCDWFLTCHQLLIIYCSKTHSKLAVGLINQDSQGARVGGVQSAQSRNQDTGVLALLTQYLGQAIQPIFGSVCSSVKWAQPSPPQQKPLGRKPDSLYYTWSPHHLVHHPRVLTDPCPSSSAELRLVCFGFKSCPIAG